jgi:hypothetical protein
MSMPFARPVPSYAIPSSERPRHFIPPLEPSQTDPDSRHQAVTPVHAVCAAHGLIGFREPGYEWRRGPVDPSLPAIRSRIYSSNCDSPQESDDVERLLPCTFQNATCAIHLRIRAIDPVARIVESAGTVVYWATRMSERLTRHCRRCLTILIASAFTFATASTHLLFSQSERDSPGAQVAIGADHVHLSAAVLPFRNGLNRIDLLGTGQPGEIIVSRRGNGNAHGHSIVMFQVLAPAVSDGSNRRMWQVVPFFGGRDDSEIGEELFRTSEGADCTLRDLRVVRRGHGHPVEVVIGSRDFGRSFADSAAVHFDFYELQANTEPLGPTYLFRHVRTVGAKGTYCDVDDAFDRELGLGPAGALRWDGPR